LDLPAIIAMPLNYADHLVDIGANEGCHGHGPAVQPLLRIAGFYVPQRRQRLNGSCASRRRCDVEVSNRLSPRPHPIYELDWP
jgi:hypothetical protein